MVGHPVVFERRDTFSGEWEKRRVCLAPVGTPPRFRPLSFQDGKQETDI